jgi:hypothetical protein
VKSVKNPRSAVCKTALMTCADIFKAYGDLMVHSIDPLVSVPIDLKFLLLTIRFLRTPFFVLSNTITASTTVSEGFTR